MKYHAFMIEIMVIFHFSICQNQYDSTGIGNGDINKNIDPNTSDNNCVCVPYYQCLNDTILDDGLDIIDVRGYKNKTPKLLKRIRSSCENPWEICCKRKFDDPGDEMMPVSIEPKGCGRRNLDEIVLKIMGNPSETHFGEFPWMVVISQERIIPKNNKRLQQYIYQCGGSLIHRKVVLTAAHCIYGKEPSQLMVRVGQWNLTNKNEVLPYQESHVDNIIVHHAFNRKVLYNDYALIILSEPVTLAENVDIVCLPDQNTILDESRCFVSGWGKNSYGEQGNHQHVLKKVKLPVVPRKICQDLLRRTRLGYYFTLDKSFICAGGETGKDSCTGDGGGPLVCPVKNDENRYVQTGIVAWGIGCGENRIPGVYANVAVARQWIDEQMKRYNFDKTVYQYQRSEKEN